MKKITSVGLMICTTIFLFGFLDCKGETSTGSGDIYQYESGGDNVIGNSGSGNSCPDGTPILSNCSVESQAECSCVLP